MGRRVAADGQHAVVHADGHERRQRPARRAGGERHRAVRGDGGEQRRVHAGQRPGELAAVAVPREVHPRGVDGQSAQRRRRRRPRRTRCRGCRGCPRRRSSPSPRSTTGTARRGRRARPGRGGRTGGSRWRAPPSTAAARGRAARRGAAARAWPRPRGRSCGRSAPRHRPRWSAPRRPCRRDPAGCSVPSDRCAHRRPGRVGQSHQHRSKRREQGKYAADERSPPASAQHRGEYAPAGPPRYTH